MIQEKEKADYVAMQLVVAKLEGIGEKQDRLEKNIAGHLDKINEAVTQLAVISERQVTLNERYVQLQEQITRMQTAQAESAGKLDARLDALEKEVPEQKRVTKWFFTAVWTAAAMAVSFVAKTVGLI